MLKFLHRPFPLLGVPLVPVQHHGRSSCRPVCPSRSFGERRMEGKKKYPRLLLFLRPRE